MPLSDKGHQILREMIKKYGKEKGKKVFYSMEQKGKLKGIKEKEKK